VPRLFDQRRHPQEDEQGGGRPAPAQRAHAVAPRPAGPGKSHGEAGGRQAEHAGHETQVRDVGLQAERAGGDGDRQHGVVVAQHRPHRQQHHRPPHQRQVRVPRLRPAVGAVGVQQHGHARGDGQRAGAAAPAVTDPHGDCDGSQVERCGGRLQRPRRCAEQAVERCQQPEADGAGVAAGQAQRFDAARQPHERRVARGDVTHAQLGQREVEVGVPVGVAESDERNCDRHGQGGDGSQPGQVDGPPRRR
jgi:hypothetical protein